MNTKDQVVKNSGVGLNKLYILSKVAERKERVSSLMRKNAQSSEVWNPDDEYSVSPFQFGKDLVDINSKFHRISDTTGRIEQKKSIIIESFLSQMKTDIEITIQVINGISDKNYNNSTFQENKENIVTYAKNRLLNFFQKNPNSWNQYQKNARSSLFNLIEYLDYLKDNQQNNNQGTQASSKKPTETRSTPGGKPKVSLNLTNLRELLTNAGHNPGNGFGWDTALDAAFRSAVSDYVTKSGETIQLTPGWQWSDVAPKLKFQSNLTGAEQLVKRLIELKAEQGAPAPATPAASTPSQTKPEAIDKQKVVAGLEIMFNNIASRAIKVDKRGLDFMRDSKNFRGVIRGLGGPKSAASYCVENAGFSPEENKRIAEYKTKSAQELATFANESSEMLKVYNLFMSIKRDATRGFGKDRRGFTEDSLARSVARLMSERKPASESPTPEAASGSAADDGLSTSASIMRAIEIRKMAARKKLGI
jgi:hypothetical protein